MTIEEAADLDVQNEQVEENNDEGVELTDAEQDAYRKGWRPRDEYLANGGDERRWSNAETFLEQKDIGNIRKQMDAVKRDLAAEKQSKERLEKAFQQGLQMQREQLERQYEDRIRTAASEGDMEAYDALQTEKAEAVGKLKEPEPEEPTDGSDPVVTTWAAENPWFKHDEGARNVANVAFDKYRARNPDASMEDALEAAEKRVRKTHPQYFDEDIDDEPAPKTRKNGKERTMADVKVASGNRGGTGKAKDAPYRLNEDEKRAAAMLIRDGVFKDEAEYTAALQARNSERRETVNPDLVNQIVQQLQRN